MDWDDSLGHLSPPSGGGRRGRLSQADTIYHKNTIITLATARERCLTGNISPSTEQLEAEETLDMSVGDTSSEMTNPCLVSVQQPSEPTIPAIDSRIQSDTSSNNTTTEQEVLCELSGTPQLLENAAPPPSPSAYSDDVEGAPAEAEEEATDVAPPLQHSQTQATSPSAQQALVEPTSSENADFPIQPVEYGTTSHSSAILPQALVSETETHAVDSIPRGVEEMTPPQPSLSSIAAPNVADLLPKIQTKSILQDDSTDKVWKDWNYSQLKEKLESVYEDVVFHRRNLFLVPTGKAGKDFIKELTFWLKQLNNNTKLNGVAVLAFMVLPSLLLQKPSAKSKAKDHSAALVRRLSTWQRGEIDELLREVKQIQQRFKKTKVKRSQEDVARIFSKLVMEGKVSAAMKFLDNEHSAGVLELNEKTINDLKEKHPQSEPLSEQGQLKGPIRTVPDHFFEPINEQEVLKATLKTKGSAGPSAMDADAFRRILCSKNFSTCGKELREEIAILTKNLATKHFHPEILGPYVNSRLIPLDKNPGVRPIGIGEVLRRIVGKVISKHASEYIKEAAGPLQVCAGHGAGAEAAIHSMREVFEREGTDAVLLIDAANAFNKLNRATALYNIQIICPEISTYVINTYRHPSRLFITGGIEISSQEGTTQGDPLAMPWYALSTTTMISHLSHNSTNIHQIWLADDAAGAGKIKNLHDWYDSLKKVGKHHGYEVNGSKCWLICKTEEVAAQASQKFGNTVNITTEGMRHLGAVIGSKVYKDHYCSEKVETWAKELERLAEIAETEPQAAYAVYTKGFKSKFTYFLRTIEKMEEYLEPIEAVLVEKLIPAFFGGDSPDIPREIIALNPNDGGLGIENLEETAAFQFQASKIKTQIHVDTIVNQEQTMRELTEDGRTQKDTEGQVRQSKQQRRKEKTEAPIPDYMKRCVEQARDNGASSWLNALPLKDQKLNLNKEQFTDALKLRYNQRLRNLPTHCPCGEVFNVEHALNCKKGGFIAQRHDNLRDLFTCLLSKVCKNVMVEPHLLPLTGETLKNRSGNTSAEARLDVKAGGFWQRSQTAFFDIRVTHVNSSSQAQKSTQKIFKSHEDSKKREYLERVLNVEQGVFTPLVFGTNGGMGKECQMFMKQLATLLAEKTDEKYSDTVTWMRTRVSMEILRSAITCIRGSRVPFRKGTDTTGDGFSLMAREADML